MDMKSFVKQTPPDERERVAMLAGTTDAYLQQLAGGHRKPSSALAKRLEEASCGKLTRLKLLYPDD
jgi:hypothetical protein